MRTLLIALAISLTPLSVFAADFGLVGSLQAHFEPELLPIAYQVIRCESTFRQFDEDGQVLRGRAVREDVGIFQINEKYHLDDSIRLGYNIYTLEGNIGYARYLYTHYGWQPWSASQPCWSFTAVAD